ncbi:hypothetical protein RQP46_007739 [Phenoliferia psychrophenolica]
MSGWLLPTFKVVSITFAVSAIATGAQALVDPIGFSKFFGLPIGSPERASSSDNAASARDDRSRTLAYISLMGIRQLGTGIVLVAFAWQSKWVEVATVLAVIGFVVAGTDGLYIARGGNASDGRWHAIPGAAIAVLSIAVLRSSS